MLHASSQVARAKEDEDEENGLHELTIKFMQHKKDIIFNKS
jgi:hypothetical protein